MVIGVVGVVCGECVAVVFGVAAIVKIGGFGNIVVSKGMGVDAGIDEVIEISNVSWKILKWEQLRVIVWLFELAVIWEILIAVIRYGFR